MRIMRRLNSFMFLVLELFEDIYFDRYIEIINE